MSLSTSEPNAASGSSRSALVTGASGFLGSQIVGRLLDRGWKVRGLCRRRSPELEAHNVEMVYADLADAVRVRQACDGVDSVFHVAAKVGIWGPYQAFHEANVVGTQAVINGCRDFEVGKLIYTSTPSVVFHAAGLAGVDEGQPYGTDFPCAYPQTKAIAEKAILTAHGQPPGFLKTVALRPHLIWGPGDPNLVPRAIKRARAGKLRVVGDGRNRVDLTYIDNVVDAHLLAERALDRENRNPGGKAYFISNDDPVLLWDWINQILRAHGVPPIEKSMSYRRARGLGALCETLWRILRLRNEPPMTRFLAAELAKDHWFDQTAAKRDLGYQPAISMEEGLRRLLTK